MILAFVHRRLKLVNYVLHLFLHDLINLFFFLITFFILDPHLGNQGWHWVSLPSVITYQYSLQSRFEEDFETIKVQRSDVVINFYKKKAGRSSVTID